MTEFTIVLLFCLSPLAWWLSGLIVGKSDRSGGGAWEQGPKARSARFFFHRPLLGRWSPTAVRRLRSLAVHGPDSLLPPSDPSSHVLTCSLFGAAWLLRADVSSDPDLPAFTAGVEVAVTVLILGIGAVVVVGLVRWALNR